MAETSGVTLIEGGRVYDHHRDADQPPIADVLIVDDRIATIEPDIATRIRGGQGHSVLASRFRWTTG